MEKEPKIFMVAGEASADMHGAALLGELKHLQPELTCFGVGGARLASTGMRISVRADELNVVGVFDWLDKAKEVWNSYQKLLRLIDEEKPDLAVLLDLPDLNLLLAKRLHSRGIPVVYYISPQVWAWRKYRIGKIKRCVQKMLVVFPFEQDFYRKHGVDVEFVGHPLLDSVRSRSEDRPQEEIVRAPRIALLPGSRGSEVRYHGPLFRDLVNSLALSYPKAEFRLPVASTLSKEKVAERIPCPQISLETTPAQEILRWADVAVVASGTATLETALVGTPFCLVYKISPTSGFFYQKVFRYRGFLGMPNLLAGREVIREFFQQRAEAPLVKEEVVKLIENESYRKSVASALAQCREKLGSPGASRRSAEAIVGVLNSCS